MKKILKRVICFVLLAMPVAGLFAQGEESAKPGVKVLSAIKDGNVVLRWAPNTPVAWELANRYGYTVERYTVMRDSSLLPRPEKVVLNNEAIKPWPMMEWRYLVEEDDFAAVAAQAIYGETFELTNNYATDISQVYLKSKEMESRFSFALFSADHSYKVAEASGLTITDQAVRENERYLYKVYANIPKEKIELDTGFVYTGLDDYVPLPQPSGVEAKFGDKVALVSWDWARLEEFYNSFILERSTDGGKTFLPVTDQPILNSEKESKMTPLKMMYIDSLAQNNIKVFYRVKGLTSFGDVSPASDTLSGIPRPFLTQTPSINASEVDENGVLIKWDFPQEANDLIEGFRLYRAGKFNGGYQLIKDKISPQLREMRDVSPPGSSNYYAVSAYDKYGNENKSLPAMAMVEDSIPPLPPTGLRGTIDSLGIVSLSWEPNQEEDLRGYRVYQANFADEEFGEVTVGAVENTTYNDTISIKTLTKSVFYKITAIDKHYNPSGFSEVVELKRPDLYPPAKPLFKTAKSDENGIALEWIASPSNDVVQYTLYRKGGSENNWTPIAIIEDFSTYNTFLDSLALPGGFYEYTLVALDDSGLESDPAKPVGLKRLDDGKKPVIKDVFAKADRENKHIQLAWEYDQPGVEKYLIYKSTESGKMRLYKSLKASEKEFRDDQLRVNTIYKYRIQAQYVNGSLSPFSKEIEVNY